MKFLSLASGSSGNVQYIEYKDTRILVDAGLSGKAAEKLLNSAGVDPRSLDGIFITHEHMDHAKGAGVLSRRFNLPLIANYKTWTKLHDIVKKIDNDNIIEFDIDEPFYFRDLWVRPLATYHDAICPNGFVFQSENKKISMLTDTGMVDDKMIDIIKDADLYFLESNHDEDMLAYGYYPPYLKRRIASIEGHLSNDACANLLKKVIKGQGEIVMLSHLSKDNNSPKKAFETNLKSLEEMGKIVRENDQVELCVAPRSEKSKVFILEEK